MSPRPQTVPLLQTPVRHPADLPPWPQRPQWGGVFPPPRTDDSSSSREPHAPLGHPPSHPGPMQPSQDAPRHTGHIRQPATRPDNVYRNRNHQETDQLTEEEWWKLMNYPNSSRLSTSSSYYSDKMAQLSQEGRVAFMNFLLATAVPPHENSLPLPSNVKEWQISDIMHMKPQDKKEWKLTCHEELDSLCKRKVFELVNLP